MIVSSDTILPGDGTVFATLEAIDYDYSVTRCCVNDRMIYYSETTLYLLVRADVLECAGASNWNVLVHLIGMCWCI